ncbi:glycosyltransferase family 9 protein [Rhodopila globiformis]|uniref:Heptosyltransferase n=1 Tax=Rhodopila globiformis TaxID=1071 RepID=A0A2S6NMX8_RHOGL|nr:glycosyltransferase family 9 protein [Rhodopila globiformis]PPQ37877.1 heptosyltransferase [Rhodopila globiformis]
MKILFVTSNRLGDAVLSTGLLDHLIRAHPGARITVVCGPVAEGVFARMPNRDRTIVLRKLPRGRHWLPLWAATLPHLWDLVVDIRGSALSWLVPTRRRAVFRRTGGPKIAELAAILGLSPPPAPVAWTASADHQRIDARLPPGRPIIALAPTANWAPKLWPADRFAAAFRRLAGPDTLPVVLGGPGEAEQAMAAPVLAALPEAIDLVGRLTLPEAAACLQRATLFIGNDSGLMHLAAAAGAPTIGLFGPTDAATYGPAGPRAVAVVAGSMDAITVDRVVAAARALLDQAPMAATSSASTAGTSRRVVSI